jgi:hypothetical protein
MIAKGGDVNSGASCRFKNGHPFLGFDIFVIDSQGNFTHFTTPWRIT